MTATAAAVAMNRWRQPYHEYGFTVAAAAIEAAATGVTSAAHRSLGFHDIRGGCYGHGGGW